MSCISPLLVLFYSFSCPFLLYSFAAVQIFFFGMDKELQQVADLITANIISTTKAVLTVDEAAKYMGISKSTLYKMTMRKQIPHSKPNGKVCYFDRLELERWLMSNRQATADELQDRAQAYCAHTRTSNKKGGRP